MCEREFRDLEKDGESMHLVTNYLTEWNLHLY